jgi:hypothetical protein
MLPSILKRLPVICAFLSPAWSANGMILSLSKDLVKLKCHEFLGYRTNANAELKNFSRTLGSAFEPERLKHYPFRPHRDLPKDAQAPHNNIPPDGEQVQANQTDRFNVEVVLA